MKPHEKNIQKNLSSRRMFQNHQITTLLRKLSLSDRLLPSIPNIPKKIQLKNCLVYHQHDTLGSG